MSARQSQQHGFRQFIADVANVLGFRPRRYVEHKYPFPAVPTTASGHGYRIVQPTGGMAPITMQRAIPEKELTLEQRNALARKNLSPKQISAISTVKNLTPEQLPSHVQQATGQVPAASGILPGMDEVRRRISAPKLQSIPVEKMSKPLWVEQLTPAKIPEMETIPSWMTQTPPGQPTGALPIERQPTLVPIVPDTYLPEPGQCLDPFLVDRRSQALSPTQKEMEPDLGEEDDDEKTVTRKAVQKERS